MSLNVKSLLIPHRENGPSPTLLFRLHWCLSLRTLFRKPFGKDGLYGPNYNNSKGVIFCRWYLPSDLLPHTGDSVEPWILSMHLERRQINCVDFFFVTHPIELKGKTPRFSCLPNLVLYTAKKKFKYLLIGSILVELVIYPEVVLVFKHSFASDLKIHISGLSTD